MKIVLNTKVWLGKDWDLIPTGIELTEEEENIEFENSGRTIQFSLTELKEAISTLEKWKEKFKS